jgi:hypothetical protein
MDLDALFQAFFSPQFLFICLAVYVATYVVRLAIRAIWKGSSTHRIWSELGVPLLPVVLGGLLGLAAKTFVWPDLASKTALGRIMYGAICGMFSAFVYGRVRGWLKSKPGADPKMDDQLLPAISVSLSGTPAAPSTPPVPVVVPPPAVIPTMPAAPPVVTDVKKV